MLLVLLTNNQKGKKLHRVPILAYILTFKFIKLCIDDTHLDASSKLDAEIITQMLIKLFFSNVLQR